MIKKKEQSWFLSLDGSNRTCANGFVFRVCCFHNGLLESDNIFSFQFNGVNGWSDLFNPAMLFLFSLFFYQLACNRSVWRIRKQIFNRPLIHCFFHVKVQEVMQEPITEDTAKSFNVEKKLLDWCKERLKGWV